MVPNYTCFRVADSFSVPRLRRLHQMGAAIGWLQRDSSRSSEGRVLGPRSGFPRNSWAASAFQRMLGARRVPDARQRHDVEVEQPLSTASTLRNWCCTPSGMVNGAHEKRAKKDTDTEHESRGRQDYNRPEYMKNDISLPRGQEKLREPEAARCMQMETFVWHMDNQDSQLCRTAVLKTS